MSKNDFKVPDFKKLAKEITEAIYIVSEVEAIAFFRSSFDKGGFTDRNFQKWDDRVSPDYRPGGKLLNATGFLKDSIETADKGSNYITFGSYVPYAKIHNEGGIIHVPVTQRMRKYFWAMFKKTNDNKWKYMALTKKDSITLKFPQRKFMGESAALMSNLDKELKRIIFEKFKKMPNQ